MSNLKTLEALQDASRILNRAAFNAASGSMAVWKILDHAKQHINRQMEDALRN